MVGANFFLQERWRTRLEPDVICCSLAISACDTCSDGSQPWACCMKWRSLVASNVVNYGAVISACEKGQRWGHALGLLQVSWLVLRFAGHVMQEDGSTIGMANNQDELRLLQTKVLGSESQQITTNTHTHILRGVFSIGACLLRNEAGPKYLRAYV